MFVKKSDIESLQHKINILEMQVDRLRGELRMVHDDQGNTHHRLDVLLDKLGYTIMPRPERTIIVSTKKLNKVGDRTKLKEWN